MKKKQIVVSCTYSETGRPPEELIRESFRLFLQKELLSPAAHRPLQHDRGDE